MMARQLLKDTKKSRTSTLMPEKHIVRPGKRSKFLSWPPDPKLSEGEF